MIIGAIILLLAVLLFSPVIVTLAYRDGDYGASVRYLFLKIDFSPEAMAKRAEKQSKRAVKKEFKKQVEEEETQKKERKAFVDTVKTVWSYVKATKKGLNTLRRHLVFYRIKVTAVIAREDAHQTAVTYGTVCTIVSTGLGVLSSIFPVREPKISITPDFVSERTRVDASFKVRISPVYAIAAGIQILWQFLKAQSGNKKKRQRVKGGKRNEPTKACQ